MAKAVCLGCGEMKSGAFAPCPKCALVPQDPESRARHLLASDHNANRARLEEIAALVREKKPVEFDPEKLKDLVEKYTLPADGVTPKKTEGMTPEEKWFYIKFAIFLGSVILFSLFLDYYSGQLPPPGN